MDGSTSVAEGSFGLYGRYADGTIYAKPAVGFLQAVTAGQDYSNANIRILNVVSSDTLDLSQWGSNGVGYLDGYIALTNDGKRHGVGIGLQRQPVCRQRRWTR